jgi:hypothetical protein
VFPNPKIFVYIEKGRGQSEGCRLKRICRYGRVCTC